MREQETKNRNLGVSVAPMMDWTDRHCRYFLRLLSPHATLYTEMVTAAAIHHGDREKLLQFNDAEHPVVLQVGGSDPELMAAAALAGEQAGYDAININVGCPSERVQSGSFGACLMAEPELVARCFEAMQTRVSVPVTVKCRLGIDEQDSEAFFLKFIDTLRDAGCQHFDVHARIAILKGLSPKENRMIPPLNYQRVFDLKSRYPELTVFLNGGVNTDALVDTALPVVDGVMIGREAYHNPYWLAVLDARLHNNTAPARRDVVHAMVEYAENAMRQGALLKHITRHMLGLFAGEPGARLWRRTLSEKAHQPDATPQLLLEALAARDRIAA
ncbi:MAG: tRNA dihydrouridine(20/20a) synthase DusA [Pseudomonadota bacterium]